MGMKMTPRAMIRAADARDAASLAALGMQVWLHTYATTGVSAVIAEYVLAELTPGKFLGLIDDPEASLFVAEIEGHLVGYIVVRYGADSPEADSNVEIETLYVQEHFLRLGIGTALLRRAQAETKRRTGSGRICLTVNIYNANAIAFYKRHGFVHAGTAYFALGAEKHENHVLVCQDV